jgi:hypothetical protein
MSNSQTANPDSEGYCPDDKNGSGSKEQQPDDQDSRGTSYFKSNQREHSSQRTFKEKSERTEHQKSSFKSARSVFESTTITVAKLSQKETVSSSTSNASVKQSFQTVNQKSQNSKASTLGNPESNKLCDTPSPSKQPPDKPDRKSKTTSHKYDSSSHSLHTGEKDPALAAPQDNSSDDSKQIKTTIFDYLHELPQQDSL